MSCPDAIFYKFSELLKIVLYENPLSPIIMSTQTRVIKCLYYFCLINVGQKGNKAA